MSDKTYQQIKYLLTDVVGIVQEMNDDSNRFYDELQELTNLIRKSGATNEQMNKIINLGQMCINDTDDADFMASYQDGDKFNNYVKSVLKSLK